MGRRNALFPVIRDTYIYIIIVSTKGHHFGLRGQLKAVD